MKARSAFIIVAPFLLLTAGQVLDGASTVWFLNNGTYRCVEGNPIYGHYPSAARIMAVKGAQIGFTSTIMWILKKKGHTRAAHELGYLSGGVGLIAATWNVVACH